MKNLLPVLALVLSVVALGAVVVSKPTVVPQFGAQSEGVVEGNCFKLNGTFHCVTGKALTKATSTPVAIKSPSATSTLVFAGCRVDVASSTVATRWDVARAANAFATTTAIGTLTNVAAGAQSYINASTSPQAGNANVFAPNTFLVLGVREGVTPGSDGLGFVPSGNCVAEFVTQS